MKNFKVGDRVIVTESEYNGKGTVVHVTDIDCLIKFDKEIGSYSHDCFSNYQSDRRDLWCVHLHCIKHIEKSITKKELLKRIEALEAKVGVEKKTELVVGKWYKYGRAILNYQGLKYKLIQAYGIVGDDSWLETDNCGYTPEEWQEATPQEVEEALIKEAKRRGYKKGVEAFFGSGRWNRVIDSDEYHFSLKDNMLSIGTDIILNNGKWAEVIKNDDKFAELKEAHKNGAVIQFKDDMIDWTDCAWNEPCWNPNNEYRIKPDDKPNIKPRLGRKQERVVLDDNNNGHEVCTFHDKYKYLAPLFVEFLNNNNGAN